MNYHASDQMEKLSSTIKKNSNKLKVTKLMIVHDHLSGQLRAWILFYYGLLPCTVWPGLNSWFCCVFLVLCTWSHYSTNFYKFSYSPKNSTAVTETQIAITGLDILSIKIGMDSTAAAFANKRVTNSKWCFSTSGKILLACFFSAGFPPLWRTFKLKISNESKPMVNPDIKPTKYRHKLNCYSCHCSIIV